MSTVVKMGPISESPNHSTARKAQHTAGKVSATMIQPSRNASTCRCKPMISPRMPPMIMEARRPRMIRLSVSQTTT